MSNIFAREQTPAEVIEAIGGHGGRGRAWDDLDEDDRSLGVAKLRLAGVYDDRQDGFFMLRVRIPGGRLTADQADVVARVTRDFGERPGGEDGPERFVEITTRQDLQLHWIRFESLGQIWRRLEAVGLTSEQACGDTLRNVTSCAVDGIDAAAVLDTAPAVGAIGELARDEPRLTAFLPRKFKVAVTGCPTDCVVARLHDLAFTPARRDGKLGFNVHAGGGLSDSPRLASALDLFARPEEAAAVVRAALRLFVDRGDFQNKAVNRFRVLVHELGPETVAEEIRSRLPFRAQAAGEDLSTWRAEDHLGVHADRFGRRFVGLCVPLGRLFAEELAEVARVARTHGDGGIRLTQRQNLVLTGVRDVHPLLGEEIVGRFPAFPDPFERAVIACTSAPFCKFGILNVKAYGAELIERLRAGVPRERWGALEGLRIHLSGCKASCAQVQAAHIGLRASMAKAEDAYADGFDVALGGDVGAGRLGRWKALEIEAGRAFDAVAEALTRAEGPEDAAARFEEARG